MLEKRKTKFRISVLLLAALVGVLLFSQWSVVSDGWLVRAANETTEDVIDEEEIEETEGDIKDAEKKLQKKEQQKLQISNEIGAIRGNINVVQGKMNETEEEISRLGSEIDKSEKDIQQKKEVLAETIRNLNQLDIELSLMLLESDYQWSEYFLMHDGLDNLEQEILTVMEEIEEKKNEFDKQKKDQQQVLEMHGDQKQTLEYERNRQSNLLNQTKADIGQLNAKLNKLRSELSSLLGKGYDAKDIKDAARFASKVTGVRKDFIMGMLVVESDLGRYTGGCKYKESRMSSYRKGIFKKICKELDYNYKKMKVSCPPRGYKGTGGAMGVAQFMPDTWWGYKSSIASATGHNPPDPWDLTDGVTAMALKLAKVSGVTKHKESAECKAAKLYLSGTTSSKYDWYCDKVLYWADHYKKLL